MGLTKTYGPSSNEVTALAGVTTSFAAGTFTAVMGPSGSGKTTLLQCASGLDRPTTGTVYVDGREFVQGSEAAITRFRRTRIGFVFQQYNLLPTLTALQNVTLPMRLAGRKVSRKQCLALLDQVGLAGYADRRPTELSGGQQQRVAIARGLASRPSIVFADEPTGALDGTSAAAVLALLRQAVDEHHQTIVMVTHDPIAAAFADSVVFLTDGRIVGTMKDPSAAAVSEQMLRLDLARRNGGQR
ncbi:ABC transporter ATP-binding protein [Plantactinospora soyae]|uniref:ABC transport system ATP-binding protein n=1 Tax=Plantactinospora soyae TaxID=1544732 RepID=A0A927R1C0_9ACTN|nr:ABC transporter ATP-binding protein [Plantactinospora soyae]MBE1489553.1 putative ABC transport system ATP-binding protein [Plantactinospora soyae]